MLLIYVTIFLFNFFSIERRNADDVNLLHDNIDTLKKNTQTLIDASKEVGQEVNTEKIKYMLLTCHQIQGKMTT
jgi:hypothetical protein